MTGPKLPGQRGFYDDIRPFQRRDVKVRTEAFAPTRGQQVRRQMVWGTLFLLVMVGIFACHVRLQSREAKQVPKASSVWKGVAVKPAAGSQPIQR
jgi:hypothetical protein